MTVRRVRLGVAILVISTSFFSGAKAVGLVISCKGDAIRDFKSFNLPPKTVQETRFYVIDEAGRSVSSLSDGELVPLCDKSGTPCHVDFTAAGVKIDYQNGEEMLKFILDRSGNSVGHQSENATLVTTFQGRCQHNDPPAGVPSK